MLVLQSHTQTRKESWFNMANWEREIMILANDFCLDNLKVKSICKNVNSMEITDDQKYRKAQSSHVPFYISDHH